MEIKNSFWTGKRVLLTGHTGFKGAWLSLWLQKLGAEVLGLSLEPPTKPSLFELGAVSEKMISLHGDIREPAALKAAFERIKPEVVFHLAAQPLVRFSYEHPVDTLATNVMGTINVLEQIRNFSGVRAAVIITTDKVYDNKEWDRPYAERDSLGGFDPYSSSKACAELAVASYRNSFFSSGKGTAIATARSGNVIGGGDWASDRLVPDFIRGFQVGRPVQIRNPKSIRPWQHVLEPLWGYLILGQRLFENGPQYAEAWNFGPMDGDAKPVQWIADQLVGAWGDHASWVQDSSSHPHEAGVLKLDWSKAKSRLEWQPQWRLELALQKTVDWFKAYADGVAPRELCLKQISEYEKAVYTNPPHKM
jgi:CDP-glucose 4,6-dehydratase